MMIPIGAQAEATVYGRVNNAIVLEDKGGKNESTADVKTVGSRFGIKANSDLGNGMTAHGHYEFATNTDDGAGGVLSTRIATAGVSGGFGRVDVGNQWSAFYNSVGVDLDPTYTVGTSGVTPFRSPNTIKYSNSVGPLSLEADLRLGDEGGEGASLSGNGGGIGIRVAATENVTVAAAFDLDDQTDIVTTTDATYNTGAADSTVTVKTPEKKENGLEHSRASITGKISLGQFWGSLGWSSHEAEDMEGETKADKEYITAFVGMSITDSTSGWVGFSQLEEEGEKAEPSKVSAGLYHHMGGGLRFWYEGASEDKDKPNTDNEVVHYIGIRYDF